MVIVIIVCMYVCMSGMYGYSYYCMYVCMYVCMSGMYGYSYSIIVLLYV